MLRLLEFLRASSTIIIEVFKIKFISILQLLKFIVENNLKINYDCNYWNLRNIILLNNILIINVKYTKVSYCYYSILNSFN